jgi:hypothetical protein
MNSMSSANRNTAKGKNDFRSDSADLCSLLLDVLNETNLSFKPDHTLTSGKWISMPAPIAANQKELPLRALIATSRDHGGGIKGAIKYQCEQNDTAFFIRWNITSSNNGLELSVTCESIAPAAFECTLVTQLSNPHNYKSTLYIKAP